MTIRFEDPILVIGGGSIGERHIQNLGKLGYHNIIVLRTRALPFRNVDPDAVKTVTDWEAALVHQPKAAFICTPTALHISQTIRCVENGIHVLVEKPLSHNGEGISDLESAFQGTQPFIQVGYMMRYHPHAQQLKTWIQEETWGRLVSFSTWWGEYLPNWHPWEDYRESYAARKELGGGAALTLSHDLDLALWMVNAPLRTHHLIKNYRSDLEVDVDSAADFLLGFENGISGHVHLNFFQQVPKREYRFEFTGASVCFDFFRHRMEVVQPHGNQVFELNGFDRNDLFISQTKDFFHRIDLFTPEESLRNIHDAARIVELCDPFHS
jgi:predicted dehydrogenase